MNQRGLIVYMDFMMNVKDDIVLNYGKYSVMYLIVYLFLH
jgi:hypothetical protein